MKTHILFLFVTLLVTTQQSVEDKMLGCWAFDSTEKTFVKVSKLNTKGLAIEFKNNNKLVFTYHSGICGNEKPQLRDGIWSVEDSVLNIRYNIYDKKFSSHFGVKKTTSIQFHIQKITNNVLVIRDL